MLELAGVLNQYNHCVCVDGTKMALSQERDRLWSVMTGAQELVMMVTSLMLRQRPDGVSLQLGGKLLVLASLIY